MAVVAPQDPPVEEPHGGIGQPAERRQKTIHARAIITIGLTEKLLQEPLFALHAVDHVKIIKHDVSRGEIEIIEQQHQA